MIPCNKQTFFFAKPLNKLFKDHIQGRRLNLNLKSSYLRVLSIVSTVSFFAGNPVYLYQCFGRYELYDLHNQYVYKCIGVMVYILLCTRVCTQKLIIFTCVN